MEPCVGTREEDLQTEVQWLLAEMEDGSCLALIPLLDGNVRFSLKGGVEGLSLVGETGDPTIACAGGVAALLVQGDDPYTVLQRAARAILNRYPECLARVEKPVPDFIDRFGWCTWDAFYKEVSEEKVIEGLESFRKGGLEPRFLILDDGWQSVRQSATGEDRLVSLAPNQKFGGDLKRLVSVTKENFSVSTFFVWHALTGYWGGLDESEMSEYQPRTVARSFGPGILEKGASWNIGPWGSVLGVPAADKVYRFYDDYHQSLAKCGVDGVKVDNQAMLEAVSSGQGGRVALAKVFRRALEKSVGDRFDGRLINCMSCTMEVLYLSRDSNLIRTSDDFYPEKPHKQGAHLFRNAHTSMWFGQFMWPDWDMFQSSHPTAQMHAAARSISGGPVYVSDKPGQHDFSVLNKLALSDGTILRSDAPGQLARDCVFANPTVEDVPLKIFNRNGQSGVVGVFNVQYHEREEERKRVSGEVSPSDVEGIVGEHFAVLFHRSQQLCLLDRDESLDLGLDEGEWELISFVPVEKRFAALGLADKYNSSAAILMTEWTSENRCSVTLRDGGAFMAWSERKPKRVLLEEREVSQIRYLDTGKLLVELPRGGEITIGFEF